MRRRRRDQAADQAHAWRPSPLQRSPSEPARETISRRTCTGRSRRACKEAAGLRTAGSRSVRKKVSRLAPRRGQTIRNDRGCAVKRCTTACYRFAVTTPDRQNAYPQGESPRCEVDGRTVRVHVRAMNFGQAWRTSGTVETTFRLVVPLRYLDTFLRRAGWLEDAQEYPEDRTAFESELARRDWPAVDAIMNDPTLLGMLADELGYDFLLHAADASADADDFVLNTVERRSVEGTNVVIYGRCRRPSDGVAYQDV